MLALLAVALGLGALVGIHEASHMFVAKRFGIKVLKFSFGFGPRLFGHTYNGTSYELRLLPLGGFVQFDGENPDDRTGFFGLAWYKRAMVALAGPVSNLLIGFGLLAGILIFCKGWPVLEGLERASTITMLIVTETLKWIGGLFGGTSHAADMSGPIGVTTVMAKSFNSGMVDFAFVLSAVSLSLGLFNLFPIPGLDGGHVALYTFEGLTGTKPSAKVYGVWNIIGLVLLLSLMVFMIGMDVLKLLK